MLTLFSDLTRKVTMQNLYHDGGFSSMGMSRRAMKTYEKGMRFEDVREPVSFRQVVSDSHRHISPCLVRLNGKYFVYPIRGLLHYVEICSAIIKNPSAPMVVVWL